MKNPSVLVAIALVLFAIAMVWKVGLQGLLPLSLSVAVLAHRLDPQKRFWRRSAINNG